MNFLDVTLNLEKGTYAPFRKPNDTPMYVHKQSNHPPNVIKEIPKSINKRLSTVSSSKEEFDLAKADYQRALDDSGYTHELVFEEPATRKKKRRRTRDVLWFNPPWNMAVTTNVGASFLRLVDKHFPKGNPLHKILNRNTIKVSYSCTKNIKSIMNSQNQKTIHGTNERVKEDRCNCQRNRKDKCPLKGSCVQKEAIYQATVKYGDAEEKKYVGSTVDFKRRYYGHTSSFKKESLKHSTALSSHVWEKQLGPEPNIEWSILAHAPVYKKGQRDCNLCLTEKLYIANNLNNKQHLNRRGELAQKCRHKADSFFNPRRGARGERINLHMVRGGTTTGQTLLVA